MYTDPSLQRTAAWAMVGLGGFVAATGAMTWWLGAALSPLVDGWSMAGVGTIVVVVGLWQLFTAIAPDAEDPERSY